MENQKVIIIRGGGDIATGTICRLHRCGYRVVVLETAGPLAIRRMVALSEAVYDGQAAVEGTVAELIHTPRESERIWQQGNVPMLVDPAASCIADLQPDCLVDAILAKKNIGTRKDMAPLTIGLGPGFSAGDDVDLVIETARGHNLGRIISSGPASANTGIPGAIEGITRERVIYAETGGKLTVTRDITSPITRGETIACIDRQPVTAPIDGLVRGMIRPGSLVKKGQKIADIDPRSDQPENCTTISDKARTISGGVLEALLTYL